MQALDDVKIIFYDIKIYVQQSLRRSVIDWYHLYLNHTGGSRLAKKVQEVFYSKGLVPQTEMFAKMCNTDQHFKNREYNMIHAGLKNLEHTSRTQYIVKKGLQVSGQAGSDSVITDIQQLNDRKYMKPNKAKILTYK